MGRKYLVTRVLSEIKRIVGRANYFLAISRKLGSVRFTR